MSFDIDLIAKTRACLKIHSHHLRPPFRGIFAPNSVNVARCASLIWYKSSTNWKTHLVKSNFQTRSSTKNYTKNLVESIDFLA